MLTIRLQRTGKKNHAMFRVVLAEKTAHVSKQFNEILGNYNPHTKQLVIKNPDRLNYWISQHVVLSPTIHNLLVTNKMLDQGKVKAFNVPKPEAKPEEAPAAAAPAAEGETASAEAPAAPAEGAEPAAQEPEQPAAEAASEAPAEPAA